jgi:O-antigen/teichoic acid export membrane protein
VSIKNLAGQTMWYGLSSIVGRFINYLLTPLLTVLGTSQYGEYTTVYANITFFNIIFTYGMETAYFRFVRDAEQERVYNTSATSLLLTTLPLSALMIWLQGPLSQFWSVPDHPEYVVYFALIVGFDTLAVIPFSKLRFDQRPMKFALIKLIGILINVVMVFFLIHMAPNLKTNPTWSQLLQWYDPNYGIGYAFVANLISSIVTLFFLYKEIGQFRFRFDTTLWKNMMVYALPLIIVGFGGMINETIDRTMLPKLLPGSLEFRNSQNGIYGANYKLSILIVLFISAFRMGAEPFFLKHSAEEDAPKTYARIMTLFIVVCSFCFLGVTLFIDIWKYFMRVDVHPEYAQGLVVIPVLLLSKLLLGMYYNLSIWYKITNKTAMGAYITLGGVVITLVGNFYFIPSYGFMACAWSSLACSAFMVVLSYWLGQKYYPIPYNLMRIGRSMALMMGIYFAYQLFSPRIDATMLKLCFGALLMMLYTYVIIFRWERPEFQKFPLIGKYV